MTILACSNIEAIVNFYQIWRIPLLLTFSFFDLLMCDVAQIKSQIMRHLPMNFVDTTQSFLILPPFIVEERVHSNTIPQQDMMNRDFCSYSLKNILNSHKVYNKIILEKLNTAPPFHQNKYAVYQRREHRNILFRFMHPINSSPMCANPLSELLWKTNFSFHWRARNSSQCSRSRQKRYLSFRIGAWAIIRYLGSQPNALF